MFFTAHIGICKCASIHVLLNRAIRTERLLVTIWKKFGKNRRERFGGLGSVLSVPRKSASFWSVCGRSLNAGSILVFTARACKACVVGV